MTEKPSGWRPRRALWLVPRAQWLEDCPLWILVSSSEAPGLRSPENHNLWPCWEAEPGGKPEVISHAQ